MAFRFRLASGLGLPAAALIFAAVGVGVLLGAHRFIDASNAVSHSGEVLASAGAVEARLRDAEAAHRGYLLGDAVEYLAQYQSSREQLGPLLANLAHLVEDNPGQAARAREIETLARRRLEQMDRVQADYAAGGIAAVKDHHDPANRRTSSAVGEQVRLLVEEERRLLEQRGQASRASADMLRALAVLGIPLGIAVVAWVYWLLLREIRRRGDAERIGTEANARLRDSVARLERHSADLSELNRFGGLLQNCMRPEEAVALTSQLLSRLLPGTGGTLYRVNPAQGYAEEVTHWGEHTAASVAILPPENCWALRRGQVHVLRSHGETLRCSHVQPPAIDAEYNSACIPLLAQGAQLGFIYLSAPTPDFLSEMELVQAAAEQLSMALHNLSLQDRLRLQSIRDPLTGLFNRRYLEESLARELARSERRGLPLSLMMLDLDHFKLFNDLHGHPGGDALLAALGPLLRQRTRGEDIACRYGGEEFTLILPEANLEQAARRAGELAEAVRALRVEYLGTLLPAVTCSIGVATYHHGEDTAETLLQRADKALYRAKRGGRDRIETEATAAIRAA
ncbi:sensor domain-containing diguanylate cyclase [Pseudoxanthomonas suwonensis]|uniref:sensor domain-containing diguanylate cyclase n=1 Tax=Pseudoxanthomonas suwonensis TaxID=314722 RepID=UPI0004918CC8|nr:diguanylate cyclase [Pseudoxanthomonas suwonensis]